MLSLPTQGQGKKETKNTECGKVNQSEEVRTPPPQVSRKHPTQPKGKMEGIQEGIVTQDDTSHPHKPPKAMKAHGLNKGSQEGKTARGGTQIHVPGDHTHRAGNKTNRGQSEGSKPGTPMALPS